MGYLNNRIYSSVLAVGCMFAVMPDVSASDAVTDYRLQSAVYQWYGQLDLGQAPQHLMQSPTRIDFAEYPGAIPVVGAHHILTITPMEVTDETARIEVELEYQPWMADATKSTGHYIIQTLTLNGTNGHLIASETLVNEKDDFISTYREASDLNLIRSLIFRWTHALDSPNGEALTTMLSHDARFRSPEPGDLGPVSYLDYLGSLQHSVSRRVIKNLNINASDDTGTYHIDFEYQWSATNLQGVTELAQIGISMLVAIEDGKAVIHQYHSQYLPPVTDLGAEVRC